MTSSTVEESSLMVVEDFHGKEEGEKRKRQKLSDVVEHEKISYVVVVGADSSTTKSTNLERQCDLANALLSDFVDHNEIEFQNCDENDVMDVAIDATSMLKFLESVFCDRVGILFCPGKTSFYLHNQAVVEFNCIAKLFGASTCGPHGFICFLVMTSP